MTLDECNKVLQEVGDSIPETTEILVVGGYCMLAQNARLQTSNIDFIPAYRDVSMPAKFDEVLSSDITLIPYLHLSFRKLKKYCAKVMTFGRLIVYLAGNDLLMALKLISAQNRSSEQDLIDLTALCGKASPKKAFEAYSLVSTSSTDYRSFKEDLEIETLLAKSISC
ncbi:MAG: hypothetical protein LBC41_02125 [Clostridiales bacterium]|jgi:hypothetical protein|nr:hypothetical protein [Clostridiales bacterium]